MTKEAFDPDLGLKDILETQDIASIRQRFDYTLRLGAVGLITGQVGSGKSTALRYVLSKLHPSEYKTIWITACSGSILEFYRLFLAEMGIHMAGSSKAIMMRLIKKTVREIVIEKKMKIVLVVDEASLMRLEVFAELHTITQFEQDSKPWLPIILTGRTSLIDKLMYQTSMPLASRVVARSHMEPLSRQEMEQYILHHLAITGVKTNLFEDTAITAVHQGSGGALRKANHLARGALVAAAKDQSRTVNADHVRLASTEIFLSPNAEPGCPARSKQHEKRLCRPK
jgi:type II secretory pathway predicted ATPase ExeA